MSDFFSDSDRDILDALVEHRVATAAHLSALLEIPERTVRYRLSGLRSKGYVRAVRPPADKGSAPDHWCPTRKADSWSKGERSPQGGDKAAPSTTFVEHSAAITALYVALRAALGLQVIEWIREAAAAEEFAWRGRRRKIVPDAFVVVADNDCECRAFVEIDLGSMSLTRLSQKLSGYAAYYAALAWADTHPFPPVLLLMTTSESRAEAAIRRFEQRWAQAQRHLHSSPYVAEETSVPEIAACAGARNSDEAVKEPVWLSSGGSDGLHLTDLLRPAWDRWSEQERARRELEERREQLRSELAANPERCREEIQQSGASRHFEALAEVFDDNGRIALTILLQGREAMVPTERTAFTFFSRRLAWTRRGALTAKENPEPPSEDERRVAQNLAADYLDRQKRYVARLWARHSDCRATMKAIEHLDDDKLLRADEIDRLPVLVAAHRNEASDLRARQRAYVSWREQAVERERERRRALARLVFDRAGAASALDLERLSYCRGCRQIVVPREPDLKGAVPPECSFCSLRTQTPLAEAVAEGFVRPDENRFWAVCHPPVPAWVTEEAARPLARSADPHEEW
ncbi:MAG TPA: replication-relaxation family protein [Actinomycetota bacterium]|nr:replication-relaxation family protein [Actinomycetota bacterium]